MRFFGKEQKLFVYAVLMNIKLCKKVDKTVGDVHILFTNSFASGMKYPIHFNMISRFIV